jgi:hypothetical protein
MANKQLPLSLNNQAPASVTEIAVTRAVTMLRAANAKYLIQLPSGDVVSHGGLELAPQKRPVKRQRRDPSVPYGSYTALIRAAGFDDMAVGDIITVDTTGFEAESVRGVISARASKQWGNQSCISSVKDAMIEVLRVQ